MKKNLITPFIRFKILALYYLCILVMGACDGNEAPTKEEYFLEISKTNLDFTAEADSTLIGITTTNNWYIENNSDWISISPMGGKGNSSITVSVSQNTTNKIRESYFRIAIDNEYKNIVVSQSPTDNDIEESNDVGNEESSVNLPQLTATDVFNITINAASFESSINGPDSYFIEEGFCIGTNTNPTLENSIVINYDSDIELGIYSDRFVGLKSNTTYYVRSYATNEKGTGYGPVSQFNTLASYKYTNITGATKGYFSINENSKVAFSQGNLQYQASSNTWRFAEHQYDIIGSENEKISPSYNGWIDLFGYGTSGYNGKNPYMSSLSGEEYTDIDIVGTNYDWGVYNKISNGGNTTRMWRTPTYSEWHYLIWYRTDAKALIGMATINNVKGVIILADNWSLPEGITFKSGMYTRYSNIYNENEWQKMESNGAVFFPAAGLRHGTEFEDDLGGGYHIANTMSTPKDGDWVDQKYITFIYTIQERYSPGSNFMDYYIALPTGASVRLVHDL